MKKQRKTTIYGPPGTGKTTKILSMLEEDLKTYQPEEIAFVSYTNKGVDEGKERAMLKFKLGRSRLPFFKTIHALCFSALGMDRVSVMQRDHYRLFSEKTGMSFDGYYTSDYTGVDDLYLHTIAMEQHNRTLSEQMKKELKLDMWRYEFIAKELVRIKDQLGLKDFTDMLVDYLDVGEPLPVKLAYIDEAQDLTPLQWNVVDKMFRNAERVIIAGDDDQAVYEWAGADVRQFISFSDDTIMLDHSYRMPRRIHDMARNLVGRMAIRHPKKLSPKDADGSIQQVSALYDLDLNGGELILARTKFVLRQLSKELMEQGYLFEFKGKTSINFNKIKAIISYINYTDNNVSIPNSQKGLFDIIDTNIPWFDAIKMKPFELDYYRRVIDRRSFHKPAIKMETFHTSKGSENAHVIMATDTSKKVEEMRNVYPDQELRCLFVGITRTSDKLTVLAPTRKHFCPMELLTTGE